MPTQICHQIQSIFSLPLPSNLSSPLDVLITELVALSSSSPCGRVFVYRVGHGRLMMKALCMHLFHLDLSAHLIGNITPPIAPGDLLLASAVLGDFFTVNAISRVAKNAGARVALITAKPDAESEARRCADEVVLVPAQTMVDREEGRRAGEVRLPMGSLYEGALFVLFEMVVIKLAEVLRQHPVEMGARHTNLE